MFIIRDSSPESFSSHAWNSLIYYPSFRTFKRSIIAIIQGSFYFILSLFKNSYRYIIPRLCSNSLKYSQSPFSRKKFFYLFTFSFYPPSFFRFKLISHIFHVQFTIVSASFWTFSISMLIKILSLLRRKFASRANRDNLLGQNFVDSLLPSLLSTPHQADYGIDSSPDRIPRGKVSERRIIIEAQGQLERSNSLAN